MNRLFLLTATILLAGCSAKYNTNNVQDNTEPLLKDAPVVISKPVDGAYETQVYAGSGNATVGALRAAFLRHTDSVTVYAECNDMDCLKKNHRINRGYYVIPQILHWEERATEWSGIPDKIEVKITIYNAESDNRVASTIISGKSKWATFGGDHPQDLLPEPVNAYISSLYK